MINGTSPVASQLAGTMSAGAAGELDRNAFFKLLLTQLNNQDPLSPLANEAFIAQLAQFSSLEQMQQINSNLQQAIDADLLLNQAMNNALVTTLIGKEVIARTNRFSFEPGEQIEIGLRLDRPAEQVIIDIFDQSGRRIATLQESGQPAGDHFFSWDGKDLQGRVAAPGTYVFQARLTDGNGSEYTPVAHLMRGTISGIRYDGGQARLLIGNAALELSEVESIRQTAS